jgi:Protein of unknown function (DUF1328)
MLIWPFYSPSCVEARRAAGATEIAKILFFVFVALFVVSVVAGMLKRGP